MNIDNISSASLIEFKGTPCLQIENQTASALISLFGGHLISYVPKNVNAELIWLSDKAIFNQEKALRGGTPICWPWFADLGKGENLPAHGFVRTQMWQISDISESADANNIQSTTVELTPNTLGLFNVPQSLSLKLSITIAKQCELSLETTNNSDEDVEITQALHTYFKVSDISQTSIAGITTDYYDKVTNTHNNKLSLPYHIEGETDRIHPREASTNEQIITLSGIDGFKIDIAQSGHDSVIVWNPGAEKSTTMADMEDLGYQTMLCIEAGNTQSTTIAPKTSFTLKQRFSAKKEYNYGDL
ncbi:D-hexose-6-phosphate mutarotase [Agaribacter flavus]|uniref:Putative glucose-6-phosphate 1-epimerase n=1 Tax=Agaribacter flavus TaxID=1902781 RepID=A0ABV7FM68_9ALTE